MHPQTLNSSLMVISISLSISNSLSNKSCVDKKELQSPNLSSFLKTREMSSSTKKRDSNPIKCHQLNPKQSSLFLSCAISCLPTTLTRHSACRFFPHFYSKDQTHPFTSRLSSSRLPHNLLQDQDLTTLQGKPPSL